jgi:hypothetical protein
LPKSANKLARPGSGLSSTLTVAVGLIWLALVAPLLTGCAYPTPFDNGLYGAQAPIYPERRLVLIFTREGTRAPLAGARAQVEVTPPTRLLSPASGQAVTDADGVLALTLAPVAQYDQSALKAGDIAVDYPIALKVTMLRDGRELTWDVTDNQSFARYRDPLYQGLDRDPDEAPAYLTLTAP